VLDNLTVFLQFDFPRRGDLSVGADSGVD
jgi:hypothetical protein